MSTPKTEGMSLVQAMVKSEIRLWLDSLSRREGLTRSDLVRRALYSWYEKERSADPRGFDRTLATEEARTMTGGGRTRVRRRKRAA